MKFFLIVFFTVISASAQTKDISKLSTSEKKQELIETLEWIQSKTGKSLKFYNVVEKVYRYCSLEFDAENPKQIKITYSNFDDDSEVVSYRFNMSDIHSIGYGSTPGFIVLYTYSEQRLINMTKNSESFITNSATLSYDNIVKNERMDKALNYAIKLANGGKKILKEKF